MSRIRQIKPSWWLDKELHTRLTADVREFYIGLWQLADDAGWFEWDAVRIGAELYPYSGTAKRERNVATWTIALEKLQPEAPHLVRYTCGHAVVPKMPDHQRIAGKQTFTNRDKHRECRGVSRCEPKSATDSPGRVGNGRESNGTRDGYPDAVGASEPPREGLKAKLGSFEQIVGGQR